MACKSQQYSCCPSSTILLCVCHLNITSLRYTTNKHLYSAEPTAHICPTIGQWECPYSPPCLPWLVLAGRDRVLPSHGGASSCQQNTPQSAAKVESNLSLNLSQQFTSANTQCLQKFGRAMDCPVLFQFSSDPAFRFCSTGFLFAVSMENVGGTLQWN